MVELSGGVAGHPLTRTTERLSATTADQLALRAELSAATTLHILKGKSRESLTPGVDAVVALLQKKAVEVGRDEPKERRQIFVDGQSVYMLVGDGTLDRDGRLVPSMKREVSGGERVWYKGWLGRSPSTPKETEGKAKMLKITIQTENKNGIYTVVAARGGNEARVYNVQGDKNLDPLKPFEVSYKSMLTPESGAKVPMLDLGNATGADKRRGSHMLGFREDSGWDKDVIMVRAGAEVANLVKVIGADGTTLKDGELTIAGVSSLEQLGLNLPSEKEDDRRKSREVPTIATDNGTMLFLRELTLRQLADLELPAEFKLMHLKEGQDAPAGIISLTKEKKGKVSEAAALQKATLIEIKNGTVNVDSLLDKGDPSNFVLYLLAQGNLKGGEIRERDLTARNANKIVLNLIEAISEEVKQNGHSKLEIARGVIAKKLGISNSKFGPVVAVINYLTHTLGPTNELEVDGMKYRALQAAFRPVSAGRRS